MDYGIYRPVANWREELNDPKAKQPPCTDCKERVQNLENGLIEYVGLNWDHYANELDPSKPEYEWAVTALYMDRGDQMSHDPDDQGARYPHFQHKKIDVRKLVYQYNWMDQYSLRGFVDRLAF